MSEIEKLTKMFGEFPGIGPRQAKRFVYFLMTRSPSYIKTFLDSIKELREITNICSNCMRIFQNKNNLENKDTRCEICRDEKRRKNTLMIVSRDIDFEVIEKSKTYDGIYFILGGTLPYLEKDPEKIIRSRELEEYLKNNKEIEEVIISMNATSDGDHTGEYLIKLIKNINSSIDSSRKKISIYSLGRGLSTGSELEYTDKETLTNALRNKLSIKI